MGRVFISDCLDVFKNKEIFELNDGIFDKEAKDQINSLIFGIKSFIANTFLNYEMPPEYLPVVPKIDCKAYLIG